MPDAIKGMSTIPEYSMREQLINYVNAFPATRETTGEDPVFIETLKSFATHKHTEELDSYGGAIRIADPEKMPPVLPIKANTPRFSAIYEECERLRASQPSTAPGSSFQQKVFLLTGTGAALWGKYFEDAVVQVAGQANGTENSTAIVGHPIRYTADFTQGPSAQRLDAVTAFGRWWIECNMGNYQSCGEGESITYTRDEKAPRAGTGCDSLADWRGIEGFHTYFRVLNGYIHPMPGKEKEAAAFIKEHKYDLRTNVEKIHPYGHLSQSMVQVITFGFALGRYDNPQFNPQPRNPNEVRDVDVNLACEMLLNVQYEMCARIALIKAMREPHKTIRLVLTRVGGGVFGNSPIIVDNAIKVALETIQNSGIQNIEIYISAYFPHEAKELEAQLDPRLYQTETLTLKDLKTLVPPKETPTLSTLTHATAQSSIFTPGVNSATAVPLTINKDLLFTMAGAPVFQVAREKANLILKGFYEHLAEINPKYQEKVKRLQDREERTDMPGEIGLKIFSLEDPHAYIIFGEKSLYEEFQKFIATQPDNSPTFFTSPSVQGNRLEETAAMRIKEQTTGMFYSDQSCPSTVPPSEKGLSMKCK